MNGKLAALVLVAGCVVSANVLAQASCPTAPGQDLSQAELSALLSGRYVYGNQFDGQYFNLLHAAGGSGVITDYKRGPSDASDRSSPVGSYSTPTTQVASRNVVTYTYGTFTYSYSMSPKPTGGQQPGPGTYVMCQRAAGAGPNNIGSAISVTVSNAPGPVR